MDDRGRPGVLAGIRRLVPPRDEGEKCDLCADPIADRHRHLYEPAARQIACSCAGCAVLFPAHAAGRYRLVPDRVVLLPEFELADELWNELLIPVNMAFFQKSSVAGRAVAFYPGAAGAIESQLPLEAWERIVATDPALAGLDTDVEALLANRTGPIHEYYIVPIDECYRLAGLIRARWRGFSGGTEVWKEITAFFDGLRARAAKAGSRA
ncbi:MAG: DUF5947 family protein [Candidatus Limnocylindria bacterium]